MEVLVIVVVLIVGLILYNSFKAKEPELTPEQDAERVKNMGEKFNAIGDRIKTMTVLDIANEIGGTERGVRTRLVRLELACADYDGKEFRRKVAEAGGIDNYTKKRDADIANLGRYGSLVPALICPHCQTKGQVRRSIGPTQAVLTTSNTYKSKSLTNMHCDVCETNWTV
jgi:hypothetical protein